MPVLSVILPTFNEAGSIVELIRAIRGQLDGVDCEIVVVDDSSPDGTADAVGEAFDAESDNVRVLVRTEDFGFAKSIRHGIEQARGELVLVMDSDFNHRPEHIPLMLDLIKHGQFVTGSRFLYGGSMDSRVRHLLSWVFNVFVRVSTGGMITDNLYGLFCCRRELLLRYAEKFDYIFRGFGEYYIRLLYFLEADGVSILQFPAVNGKRRAGEANSAFFKTFWVYFKATIGLSLCRFTGFRS